MSRISRLSRLAGAAASGLLLLAQVACAAEPLAEEPESPNVSADARSVALGDTLTAEEFGSLLSTDSAEYEQMHASVDGWEGKTHVQLEVDIDQTDPTRPRARVQYELDGAQMDMILIGDDVYVAAIDDSDLYLKMQVDEGPVPFGLTCTGVA